MRIFYAFAVAAAVTAASPAPAQDYPAKEITVVVPFTPGGSNDIVGRYLADGLSKLWGKPTVVENKPGAGSAIGSAYVSKAAPDGHTLLFVSSGYTTNAATQANLPFDPVKDLTPVAMAASGEIVMVAGSRVKAKTLKGFLTEAKTREMFYATAGVGSATHFAAESFASAAGLTMKPVHYKGGTEAVIDLIGGRADVYFGTVTQVRPSLSGDQLKAIAMMGPEKSKVLPEVETVADAGLADAATAFWWGVFAPAGTPPAVVEKINAGVNEIMGRPETTDFLAKQGASASPMTSADFTRFVHDELAKWKRLAKERSIAAQ
jgi:tripartite-type tricarboxylate transporter receptor subunit TctC